MSISQVALPKELHSELDYQLPEGVQMTPVKIVPTNVQQVVSPAATLTASAPQALQMTAQDVIFEIPAGQGPSVFLDHRYTTLSFRATYSVTNAGTAQVVSAANLRSHCMSWFDQCTLYGQNGATLDVISNYGLACDTILQLETDIASRDVIAMSYGLKAEAFSDPSGSLNINQGHSIPCWTGTLAQSSNRFSYCVPLNNSLIGKGAKKFFNIGATGRLQLVLRTASVLPVTLVTGTATAAATVQVTLDNFQINTVLVDVGQEGLKMLGKGDVEYFNGITYRVSSYTVPAGSGGQMSILTGLKGSSIRSITTRMSDTVLSTAGSINERYDSKMLLATGLNYNIGGVRIPSNPIDTVHNPAQSFMLLQESNSNFDAYEFKSSIIPQQFCIYSAASSVPSDADYYINSSTTSPSSLASWMFSYNFEKVSKSGILDGINANTALVYFEANTGGASLSNTNTLYFISKQDIIYVLDRRTGEIQVRM